MGSLCMYNLLSMLARHFMLNMLPHILKYSKRPCMNGLMQREISLKETSYLLQSSLGGKLGSKAKEKGP